MTDPPRDPKNDPDQCHNSGPGATPLVSAKFPSPPEKSIMRMLHRHAFAAAPLAVAVWTCFPSLAHARRGFPLFVIISDNPVLLVIGLILVAIWAYFRFSQ